MTEEEKKQFDEAINKATELAKANEKLVAEKATLIKEKSEAEAKAERYHNEALAVALSTKKTTAETTHIAPLTLDDLGIK